MVDLTLDAYRSLMPEEVREQLHLERSILWSVAGGGPVDVERRAPLSRTSRILRVMSTRAGVRFMKRRGRPLLRPLLQRVLHSPF